MVTDTANWQVAYLDCWTSRGELIDACMASAHVPWFLDLRLAAKYRCRTRSCACSAASASLTVLRIYSRRPLHGPLHGLRARALVPGPVARHQVQVPDPHLCIRPVSCDTFWPGMTFDDRP